MTTLLGDLKIEDDYTHPLGPEENFNESMYFNVFDYDRGAGGFVRIGNRANEGYAEVTLCFYRADGTVLFNYLRPHIDGNDEMNAAGMRFEVLEPMAKHRTTYDGGAVYMTDPSQLADPSAAFRGNPHKTVQLDITHEAVGPVYGSAGSQARDDQGDGFARAHYEQHMRGYGTVTVDGETMQIEGTGLRDHSWGPRYWQAIHSYRWLTVTFGPDLGIMVSEVSPSADVQNRRAVVIRGPESFDPVTNVELQSEFSGGSRYHKSMKATLDLQSGEQLVLEGDVRSFVPLRNRRAGMTTHIGEGMTEYRCNGRAALGISEYLDQVG
jgi:hypothetical protein